jgi:hypothetical protein
LVDIVPFSFEPAFHELQLEHLESGSINHERTPLFHWIEPKFFVVVTSI